MAAMIQTPSPNFNERPAGVPVSCLLLHATADTDEMSSVDWCRDPTSKVSYHLIVGRNGTVYHLVDPAKRAWHAGVSSFRGFANVNDYSIGLSFANDNTGAEPYPETQLAVAAALAAGYVRLYPALTLDRITTHRAVALPPGRKTDPQPPAFDLAAFKVRVQRELLRAA